MTGEQEDREITPASAWSSGASAPTDVTPIGPQADVAQTTGSEAQDKKRGDAFVGTTVNDRYFIERQLGEGGVGAVYLARDRKLLDRNVVVKVLLERSLRNERIVQKFQQEKEALTRVDHPGIIGILDTGELPDGKPYIVMQYVAGANLRSALFAEGMPLDRVANIIRQTGRALAAAHEQGIFHRDLKPENIMLQCLSDGEEQVRIIDFGVAKIKNSLVALSTVTPTTLGTYGYMSPEQFRGERVTAASDLYSLGVISYEMVTGRRPFNPESISQLGEVQRQGVRVKPKDLRPALPERAQELVLGALEFDPSRRSDNAREFGDNLSNALTDELPATIASLPQRPPLADTLTAVTDVVVQQVTPNSPGSRFSFSLNTPWLKVAVSFVFVAAFATMIFSVFTYRPLPSKVANTNASGAFPPAAGVSNASANANVSGTSGRSFSYWLTVQKIRDGEPYQEPFKSSGQEIFESGYKFRLNFTSSQTGYVYVFNEGVSEEGEIDFNLIYPTPVRNNGSAALGVGESIESGWNVFQGQPGTEQFWITWSSAPVGILEDSRKSAFTTEGSLKDAALITRLREFLLTHGETKPSVIKDTSRRETLVRGSSDPLVSLIELEHR